MVDIAPSSCTVEDDYQTTPDGNVLEEPMSRAANGPMGGRPATADGRAAVPTPAGGAPPTRRLSPPGVGV